jgi:hypothetical protein
MAFVDEASHYCRIRSPTSTSPSGDGSTETDSGSTASLPSSQPIIGAEALFGEIIKLSIWEHLSNGEIATVLGIEPNAVGQSCTAPRSVFPERSIIQHPHIDPHMSRSVWFGGLGWATPCGGQALCGHPSAPKHHAPSELTMTIVATALQPTAIRRRSSFRASLARRTRSRYPTSAR